MASIYSCAAVTARVFVFVVLLSLSDIYSSKRESKIYRT